jgi:hypothetical protein
MCIRAQRMLAGQVRQIMMARTRVILCCGNLSAHTIPSASAFPRTGAGRLLHCRFRGLLSVHSRYGLHARQVAIATRYSRGFSSLVASAAALIATGWSEPVPGRVTRAVDQRLFTAHPVCRLSTRKGGVLLHSNHIATVSTRWRAQNLFESLTFTSRYMYRLPAEIHQISNPQHDGMEQKNES